MKQYLIHFRFTIAYSLVLVYLVLTFKASANTINATTANYTTFLSALAPGDTLLLASGDYSNQLNLNNLNGTAVAPIVIMGSGNSTVFLGNACCNTVSITKCSYLVIKNLTIDGQHIDYIDGVKADGAEGNWAHHITLENLYIINHGGSIIGDNQTCGISTKCSTWNWTIRGCKIVAAGTGLYLGNSNGTAPFVSGIIENNLVINTKGYNMQIKMQLDTVRDDFPETSTDYQKTIIRHNVFSKDSGSTDIGVGDGARPCLLLDNFPTTGYGAHDIYEVYGNFFYNNPTEALMQVTGNTAAYNNIFVNHVAPSGYSTVVINDHNGFPPRDMKFFHNTVLSNATSGGISLTNPNSSYQQFCNANAIFCTGTPISGFLSANSVDNITDNYTNASSYVNAPSTTLTSLDLYPLSGQLQGSLSNSSIFTGCTDYNIDFNGSTYDWTYRGAYSGTGTNPGWHLQLDTMPYFENGSTGLDENYQANDFQILIYPNPVDNYLNILVAKKGLIEILNTQGQLVKSIHANDTKIHMDVSELPHGVYFLKATSDANFKNLRFLKK